MYTQLHSQVPYCAVELCVCVCMCTLPLSQAPSCVVDVCVFSRGDHVHLFEVASFTVPHCVVEVAVCPGLSEAGWRGAARAAPLFVAKFVIIARVHSLISGATPC